LKYYIKISAYAFTKMAQTFSDPKWDISNNKQLFIHTFFFVYIPSSMQRAPNGGQ